MALKEQAHLILAGVLAVAVAGGFYLGRRPDDAVGAPPPEQAQPASATPSPAPTPSNPDFLAAADAIRERDLQRARKLLEKVPEGDPDYEGARHNLGVIYAVLGELDESESTFQMLLERRPEDAEAWIGLGWARYMKGQCAEAERATLRALEIAPEHATGRYNVALLRVCQGQVPEAIEAYRRALAADPQRLVLADALRDLQGYVAVHGDQPQARYALAYLHFAMGDVPGEIRHLEAFLASDVGGMLRERAEKRIETARATAGSNGPGAASPSPSATP